MPGRQAFYVADRAVEYAMNRDIIVALTPGNSLDLTVDDAVTPGTLTHAQIIKANAVGQVVSGRVSDLGPRDLPPAVAEVYGTDFGANMYHVEVDATAPGGGGSVTSHVNSSIVRLFKSDDDTILHTSGGG